MTNGIRWKAHSDKIFLYNNTCVHLPIKFAARWFHHVLRRKTRVINYMLIIPPPGQRSSLSHCTSCKASSPGVGRWHAVLITALKVPARGIVDLSILQSLNTSSKVPVIQCKIKNRDRGACTFSSSTFQSTCQNIVHIFYSLSMLTLVRAAVRATVSRYA